MREPLRRLMVEASGTGSLEGAGVRTGRAEHPVCGDEVEVDLAIVDGRVERYAWRASGCPATVAVAAAAAAPWGLRPGVGELATSLRERLQQLGGLASHEGHAEKLLLRAVDAALGGREAP